MRRRSGTIFIQAQIKFNSLALLPPRRVPEAAGFPELTEGPFPITECVSPKTHGRQLRQKSMKPEVVKRKQLPAMFLLLHV